MRILITGGCGFLGSNLAAQALERGDEVLIFDNLSREGTGQNLDWLRTRGRFEFILGDIRNADAVTAMVRQFQPEGIFHLAGQVAMTTSLRDPRLDFEINALGSLNVLEAVKNHAPRCAIVFSSTNKVYGDLEQYSYTETSSRYVCVDRPDGFDEATSLNFHSPYGCSKGSADQYMLDFARLWGLRVAVFRHSSMYGGRQFPTFDQGWVGWFCKKALEAKQGRGETFTISGTGKQVRDVLHAEDAVRLYFAALDRIDAVRGEVFNVGGGAANSLSLLELFGLLEEFTGAKLSYTQLPPRESDQRVFVADIRKATRLLGWTPEVTSRQGIQDMLAWMESNQRIKLSVVMPAYLEAENLNLLLPRLKTTLEGLVDSHEVIVVDTVEPMDNTAEVCAVNGARYVPRKGGNSFGNAVRTGIAESRGDHVVFMDADGSHPPEFIRNLYGHAKEHDIIVASRYVRGGYSENSSLLRWMSAMLNWTYAVVLGIRCKDASNSFKLYQGPDLRALRLHCENFDIVEEILVKVTRLRPGVRILELPFTFKKRSFGQTKRNLFIFVATYVSTLVRLRFLADERA